jgi:DNA-binding LytR/AlgR family response regulator
MLVISLYLEILAVFFAFTVMANYQTTVMQGMSRNVLVLGSVLYLIVFFSSFIRLVLLYLRKTREVESLQEERTRNAQRYLQVKHKGQIRQITLDSLHYIESLDDQVKIVTDTGSWTSRMKISQLAEELPDRFLRTHRSFIVNTDCIQAFNRNEIDLPGMKIPISRSYRSGVMKTLSMDGKIKS